MHVLAFVDAAVVIFPAFDDLDAFGPFEVLDLARLGGADKPPT